jgi:hypothetical protein
MGFVRSPRAEPVQEWEALDSVQCNTALHEAVQTGDLHQINIEFSKHLKWATEWAYDDASTMTKLAIERDAVCRDPGLAHPHPARDDEIRSPRGQGSRAPPGADGETLPSKLRKSRKRTGSSDLSSLNGGLIQRRARLHANLGASSTLAMLETPRGLELLDTARNRMG